MKRIISSVLCLLLIGVVLLSAARAVNAAGSAGMSLSSNTGEVHRGEKFTLTVKLSNDQPVSNGGVILKFEKSVFKILGGSCKVSNATLGEVSAERGGGVFVLQTDAVVSGTIFTVEMQVKDDAPFGKYTISGTPSLSVACSLSGTSVTVSCDHVYGDSTRVDDEKHESTCTVCKEKNPAPHSWDSGTVLQAASCKEPGAKKLTCADCGATKNEEIPVNDAHTYGGWSQVDGSKHTRTCSTCQKIETVAHTWSSGTVTKPATCQTTGSRQLTCTGCKATKTETVPKSGHAGSSFSAVAGQTHTFTCATCNQTITEDHLYGDSWEQDASRHFYRCSICGHEKDQAAHVPGPNATATTDQVCTVCGRVLVPKGDHVHAFQENWFWDETAHWHVCDGCSERGSEGDHVFSDNCDGTCDACGMTRQPSHSAADTWSADESGHWYACGDCGEKVSFAAHAWGEGAAKICTVCQFKVTVEHDHVFHGAGATHSHVCACGEVYTADADSCQVCKDFPWWILCILEAVVFGGVIFVMFLGAKKREDFLV